MTSPTDPQVPREHVPSAERREEIDVLWDRFEGGTDCTDAYDRPTVFMALEDFWSFIVALDAQSAERTRAEACSRENEDISQVLGKVLGYPWFKDDRANFPDATESDGVCVGEHVAISLADEAAAKITRLRQALEAADEALALVPWMRSCLHESWFSSPEDAPSASSAEREAKAIETTARDALAKVKAALTSPAPVSPKGDAK